MANLDATTFNTYQPKMSVNASALVASCELAQTRNGKTYMKGVLGTKTGNVPFKIWDTKTSEDAYNGGVQGIVVDFEGEVDEYQGTKSIIIKNLGPTESGAKRTDFLNLKYDGMDLFSEFDSILESNLSEAGREVYRLLMDPVSEQFMTEYAARMAGKNHDNVYSGLVAHSLKCLKVLDRTIESYPGFLERCDRDVLYMGVALHDIGKVVEYAEGNMSQIGNLVSHRTIATEMLARRKKRVMELKGGEFYYRLMAVFAQHHGEYEEKPRTVEALVVHYVDNYEASMSGLAQNIIGAPAGESIYHHGFHIA